jgi:hypothetical protein
VGGGLEEEAARRSAVLQILEKLPMVYIGVGGPHILSFQPGLIGGHTEHGVELIAHERVTHDRDALLRQVSGDRMDLPKLRNQPIEPGQASGGSLNSPPPTNGWRWRRKHDFPGCGRVVCVMVLRQEAV